MSTKKTNLTVANSALEMLTEATKVQAETATLEVLRDMKTTQGTIEDYQQKIQELNEDLDTYRDRIKEIQSKMEKEIEDFKSHIQSVK